MRADRRTHVGSQSSLHSPARAGTAGLPIYHEEVARNVWTFSRPFMLGIVPMGGRSTAIKLESGGVWILASTELNNETKQKLDELGDVNYIVAGNNAHTMFIKQYKTAYPAAKVIGPEDIQSKPELEGIRLDIVFGTADPNPMCGFEGEIETCYFTGYANKDIACYHKASGTVMAADLLFNNPPSRHKLSLLALRPSADPPVVLEVDAVAKVDALCLHDSDRMADAAATQVEDARQSCYAS